MPLLSRRSQALLDLAYVPKAEDQVPLAYLDLTGIATSDLVTALDSIYLRSSQSGSFATSAQGSLAATALQSTTNITNNIAGTPAATVVSNASTALATANIAFAWGDHASAGYLTAAPVTKLYQVTGLTTVDLPLPETPATGSEIQVFKNQLMLRKVTDWTRAGSAVTLGVAAIGADVFDVYYSANP